MLDTQAFNERIRQDSLSRFPCSNYSWQVTESSDNRLLSVDQLNTDHLYGDILARDDVVAQLYYARRLAEKLQPAAKLVELHGGHLVSHERPAEVNISSFRLQYLLISSLYFSRLS